LVGTLQNLESLNSHLLVPNAQSKGEWEVLLKMSAQPKFDSEYSDWAFRPTRELDATLDKSVINVGVTAEDSESDIYGGGTINILRSNHGPVFGSQSTMILRNYLSRKLASQRTNRRSAYFGIDWPEDFLPMDRPRIAVRTISRATDTRTCIATLIPPGVAMTNGFVITRLRGSFLDEMFLLGVLTSRIFDWYTRRFVEMNFTFELVKAFPIPIFERHSSIAKAISLNTARLACQDSRLQGALAELDPTLVPAHNAEERANLLAQNDALVARLYRLDEDEIGIIFRTFMKGNKYDHELEQVLAEFRSQND